MDSHDDDEVEIDNQIHPVSPIEEKEEKILNMEKELLNLRKEIEEVNNLKETKSKSYSRK